MYVSHKEKDDYMYSRLRVWMCVYTMSICERPSHLSSDRHRGYVYVYSRLRMCMCVYVSMHVYVVTAIDLDMYI